jgi:hypothetical protein
MLAQQERETGKLTYRLRLKINAASVPNGKRVTARTPAVRKAIGIPHISTFSSLKHHTGYTALPYARASPNVLGMIHWHKLLLLIDGRSGMYLMTNMATSKLNIGWKGAHGRMITANGNRSDLTKVAESMPLNIDHIVIPVTIFFAPSGSKQVILGCDRAPYAGKCDRNLVNGSCEITILAMNGSEQVTFITTFLENITDRFASCSGT